jgi:hypothetical protein
MKFKQFLPVCLIAYAVIDYNVLQGYTDDSTAKSPNVTPSSMKNTGEVDTNLQLSISPGQKRYKSGEPIVINITLKNEGKADVPMGFTRPLLDFQAEVVLPKGKKASITPGGNKLMELLDSMQSHVTGVIKVGTEGHDKFTKLTEIYDLKQDGVYQITLSLMVPKRADPKKGPKSRYTYRRIGKNVSFDPTAEAPEPPTANATAVADDDAESNEFVKITSNTIRIGIGDIPDGALDEKPVEKAAPAKTDEAKSPPPVEPKVK